MPPRGLEGQKERDLVFQEYAADGRWSEGGRNVGSRSEKVPSLLCLPALLSSSLYG